MEGYDAATYGQRTARVYDERVQGARPAQVDLLEELAGEGPVLELGYRRLVLDMTTAQEAAMAFYAAAVTPRQGKASCAASQSSTSKRCSSQTGPSSAALCCQG